MDPLDLCRLDYFMIVGGYCSVVYSRFYGYALYKYIKPGFYVFVDRVGCECLGLCPRQGAMEEGVCLYADIGDASFSCHRFSGSVYRKGLGGFYKLVRPKSIAREFISI